jgi:hypothetical protein
MDRPLGSASQSPSASQLGGCCSGAGAKGLRVSTCRHPNLRRSVKRDNEDLVVADFGRSTLPTGAIVSERRRAACLAQVPWHGAGAGRATRGDLRHASRRLIGNAKADFAASVVQVWIQDTCRARYYSMNQMLICTCAPDLRRAMLGLEVNSPAQE